MQNTMLDSTISNSLQLFADKGFKIRVIMRCAEPWFVAKDVATCIEHSDTSAMCKLCREKDVAIVNGKEYSADLAEYSKGFSDDSSENPKKGGNPNIKVISEFGLYRIFAKCNLPKCEPFESWVFDEVLPSIRKTGSYSIGKTQSMMLPNFCDPAEAARAWADLYEKNQAAERRAITAEAELTSEKEAHEKDNEDFKTGLDIINAQKAQIGSNREATAMATASSARARQHFAEKVLETHASELIALRAVVDEQRSRLFDANQTAHEIYRLKVLKKDYSMNTLQNKARILLSNFAKELGKGSTPLPNGATYTDSFGRLQLSKSTYYERDVVDAVLKWVVEHPNDFARVGGKNDPFVMNGRTETA